MPPTTWPGAALLLALLLASWAAATISGAAGFGGALILLPLLAAALGVRTAVPVLTVMQLLGNASRAWFGRDQIRWRPVLAFTAGALPLCVAGALLFGGLPARASSAGVGALLLALVALRRRGLRLAPGTRGMVAGGALTGFLSAVAGSAGPLAPRCSSGWSSRPRRTWRARR